MVYTQNQVPIRSNWLTEKPSPPTEGTAGLRKKGTQNCVILCINYTESLDQKECCYEECMTLRCNCIEDASERNIDPTLTKGLCDPPLLPAANC
jgi:hypothetical protein